MFSFLFYSFFVYLSPLKVIIVGLLVQILLIWVKAQECFIK